MQFTNKLFVKPEFEVAKRMVGLLYFQARGPSKNAPLVGQMGC